MSDLAGYNNKIRIGAPDQPIMCVNNGNGIPVLEAGAALPGLALTAAEYSIHPTTVELDTTNFEGGYIFNRGNNAAANVASYGPGFGDWIAGVCEAEIVIKRASFDPLDTPFGLNAAGRAIPGFAAGIGGLIGMRLGSVHSLAIYKNSVPGVAVNGIVGGAGVGIAWLFPAVGVREFSDEGQVKGLQPLSVTFKTKGAFFVPAPTNGGALDGLLSAIFQMNQK